MDIKQNVLMAPYTTFKIGGPARYFCVVNNQFDALEAFDFAKKNKLQTFVLGGGSNILVSDSGYDGLVIKVVNKGIKILSEDSNEVLLKVASGEVWDEVVGFAVKNNWWGIENLSHIPGSTGAVAVQNAGAYGQEAKDVIDEAHVFDKNTHQILSLKNIDCGFAYRRSIFNTESKGRYIIFDIVFRLQKNGKFELSYRDLKNWFADKKPSLSDIRNAVTKIRDKKFPFPCEAKNGNAGSFFKNPSLDVPSYDELKRIMGINFNSEAVKSLEAKKFEESGLIKIPAAYLIELCGLKDQSFGGAAINKNQPLVIINKTGQATANEVLGLANKVKQEVLNKTSVELKFEPELIGFESMV